jgi:perosamine synthetase
MRNGQWVASFEKEFAEYVGAKYAIALCNGTATLHTALVALGVKPGDRVATTPLTMSATRIAILQAGAVPVYCDVDARTWLMTQRLDGPDGRVRYDWESWEALLPVSLYGLHSPDYAWEYQIDDAAQTLRKHNPRFAFTSYSFQASKILALGEGGMLVTDSEELATKAREFSSLGYRMKADQPRIDPNVLKSPTFDRHYSLGWNYRMSDLVAKRAMEGLGGGALAYAAIKLARRRNCAALYRNAIKGCDWITPQFVPEGWTHDYWTYAIALESPSLWEPFCTAIERHGGERPYAAWKLTYHEPAFRHLAPTGWVCEGSPGCPVAESLQPRLVQFQTNDLASAERNARAVRKAIEDMNWNRRVCRTIRKASDVISAATATPCS